MIDGLTTVGVGDAEGVAVGWATGEKAGGGGTGGNGSVVGLAAGDAIGEAVATGVEVGEPGVAVGIADAFVGEGAGVTATADVGVGVSTGIGEGVAVGVSVARAVAVAVGKAVAVAVGVSVGTAVEVGVGEGVGVGVARFAAAESVCPSARPGDVLPTDDGDASGAGVDERVALEPEGGVDVAVGNAPAAWPKLARNTETANNMARKRLTSQQPPKPITMPARWAVAPLEIFYQCRASETRATKWPFR